VSYLAAGAHRASEWKELAVLPEHLLREGQKRVHQFVKVGVRHGASRAA
jgi:hypothetical protein